MPNFKRYVSVYGDSGWVVFGEGVWGEGYYNEQRGRVPEEVPRTPGTLPCRTTMTN